MYRAISNSVQEIEDQPDNNYCKFNRKSMTAKLKTDGVKIVTLAKDRSLLQKHGRWYMEILEKGIAHRSITVPAPAP